MLLRFNSLISYELACDSKPLAVLECTDLNLRIRLDLLADSFDLAGLDIKLILEDIDRTERSDSRLITFNCCKLVSLGFSQKFIYFVHGKYLRFFYFNLK